MRTFIIPAIERFSDGSERTIELLVSLDEGGYITGGGGHVTVLSEGPVSRAGGMTMPTKAKDKA